MSNPELLLPKALKAEFYADEELDSLLYPGEGDIVRKFVFANGDLVTTLHHKSGEEIIAVGNGLDYYDANGLEVVAPQHEPYISMLLFEAFGEGYLGYLSDIEERQPVKLNWETY